MKYVVCLFNSLFVHCVTEILSDDLFMALLIRSRLSRGFTKLNIKDYIKYKSEGRIVPDGVNCKVINLFLSKLLMFASVLLLSYLIVQYKDIEVE